jgi:TRAP-type C4-dicarboxylate transport system permease large subunit
MANPFRAKSDYETTFFQKIVGKNAKTRALRDLEALFADSESIRSIKPSQIVDIIAPYGAGMISTGLIVAGAFLVIGMFIDAIPAIIILGTVLWPLAETAGMHPIHFAIIGVVSLAFGLVTPPYGLCLLISCAIGEIKVHQALRDVGILLIPMLLVLLLIIALPELIMALPKLLMPKFI